MGGSGCPTNPKWNKKFEPQKKPAGYMENRAIKGNGVSMTPEPQNIGTAGKSERPMRRNNAPKLINPQAVIFKNILNPSNLLDATPQIQNRSAMPSDSQRR